MALSEVEEATAAPPAVGPRSVRLHRSATYWKYRKKARGKTLAAVLEWSYVVGMNELIFDVSQEGDGGFVAECLTEGIFTQGDTWEDLCRNVRDAVDGYYFDRKDKPQRIRLHLVRDEVLAGI